MQENNRKITEVVRTWDDERGAHIEKNARSVVMPGKAEESGKMRERERERCDRGGSEKGQRKKQGSMEEEDHQLYRRPQMTGQAREEEEDGNSSKPFNTNGQCCMHCST